MGLYGNASGENTRASNEMAVGENRVISNAAGGNLEKENPGNAINPVRGH